MIDIIQCRKFESQEVLVIVQFDFGCIRSSLGQDDAVAIFFPVFTFSPYKRKAVKPAVRKHPDEWSPCQDGICWSHQYHPNRECRRKNWIRHLLCIRRPSTVQLIEPGETDVLILRIYVDACDTVTGCTQISRYLSSIMPWIKLLLNPFHDRRYVGAESFPLVKFQPVRSSCHVQPRVSVYNVLYTLFLKWWFLLGFNDSVFQETDGIAADFNT